jgi:hypothetical protein
MRNPEESYLVKLGIFLACTAGATVSMYRNRVTWKWKWARKTVHVILGAVTAYYLTPIFIGILNPYFKLNMSMVSSFAFSIGLFGFKSIDVVIDLLLFFTNKFKNDK